MISKERFRWLDGVEHISSWKKESGFRSDFCSICGSPVPNPLGNLPYLWIPAGLLDDRGGLEIVAQLCVASKAAWNSALLQGACHDDLPPNLPGFIAWLQAEDV
ncbi:GFA family protein [Jeongeupia naejangsanensis]|uniref:GFA family protein n=1 Tax=Jeongeupia naejangsanensis TaxID=613195 RepID=UPI003571350E